MNEYTPPPSLPYNPNDSYQKNPQTIVLTWSKLEFDMIPNPYNRNLKMPSARLTPYTSRITDTPPATDERRPVALGHQAAQSATWMLKLLHLSKSMSDFTDRFRSCCYTRRIQEKGASTSHSKSLGERPEGQLQCLNRCIKRHSSDLSAMISI